MNIEKMIEEIKSVNINTATMHPSEYEHLSRIFFVEIMQNGWYGMDEVAKVIQSLSYPENIKESIENIANVICDLRDQPGTSGRYPDGYNEVMRRFLSK